MPTVSDPRAPLPPVKPSMRFDRLDALRGIAIVWMAVYHFCFDLNHFGFLSPPQRLNADWFWIVQRSCIVSLFLFCAGLAQSSVMPAGPLLQRFDRRFWRRWGQVAGCALLVSIGSALVFPRSWISFGVLHGIAVMLLLCRLLAPLGRGLWVVGAVALVLPRVVRLPLFDGPLLNWVGLVTHKPITEDYVPVLPWLGVMLWGLAAGQWLRVRRPQWLAGGLVRAAQPLALLGRWSLSFYMLHQPVLFGLVAGLAWLRH